MCRAFESHQACQKTAPQSTVFDCGACFFVVSLARRTHRCVSNRIRRATSERVTLVPIFYAIKNQSPTPLFLLFAKKCRSTRLLACTALVSLAIADNFFAVTGFAPQSTVFDCGACFLLSALRGERTGASRIASGVPRRNELRLFRFFML